MRVISSQLAAWRRAFWEMLSEAQPPGDELPDKMEVQTYKDKNELDRHRNENADLET